MNIETIDVDHAKRMITELSYCLGERCENGEHLEALTVDERIIYVISIFADKVKNGGFASFFINPCGGYIRETLAALKIIGADNAAELFAEAVSRFDDGMVPEENDVREDIVEELEEQEAWDALDEVFCKEDKYETELVEGQYRFIMEKNMQSNETI